MLLLPLLVSLACRAPSSARDHSAAIEASRSQVQALLERERIPGCSVAVTIADAVVWQESFGVTDVEAKSTATAETRYRIGSVTKLVTVAALLRLSDQGALRLDDTVEKHLSDFPHGEITLRQLAGHLGGIRHYSAAEVMNTTHYESATDSLSRFAKDPLVAAPGEKYAYSSYGYDVLGAVIERVTKKRFDEAVRALVLEPLGMSATSFATDARAANLYNASESGPRPAPANDLSDRLPAGAALSTAGDLARLWMAMSKDGFLSASARTEMARSQTTADGVPTNVGLGWRIATDESGRTYLHHGGAISGGRAFALLYPAERVSVSFATNLGMANFDQKDMLAIAAHFVK